MPKTLIEGTSFYLEDLQETLTRDALEYRKAHRRAVRLDALDRNKLWEALRAKFPKYQLLPQTNHISYVKNNILASIYTVGKSAQLQFTSEEDKDVVENLNIALEHIWTTRNIAYYELLAGERAALLNLGITQVGWDNSIVTGTDKKMEKGQVVLKNIDPLKYYRDPFAQNLDEASHVVVWDDYAEEVLANHPDYKKTFNAWKQKHPDTIGSMNYNYAMSALTDKRVQFTPAVEGYHRVYTWFLKDINTGNISEIHLMDMEVVLYVKSSIKPNMYPFAELYCNIPSGDLLGTSEPAKIMDNTIVYNIMQSMIATAEYKNQRPPRFVSNASGINVNAFVQHGNEADRTFVVQGDASKAVHYHQYPQPSPASQQLVGTLTADMQAITGVDGKYTGRDTGSVITTGGVNAMLDAATMIDTTKILMYEFYAKRLSKLVISNYLEFSQKRKYLVKDKNKANAYKTVEVAYDKINSDIVMEYAINISSEMPKNKARIAAVADAMMEKQMQYSGAGIDVDLITPDEWLMMQDIPNKEYFQERMGIQRAQNWTNIVAQVVSQYSGLVENGMSSADAMNLTAQTLIGQQQAGAQQTANLEQVAQNGAIFS